MNKKYKISKSAEDVAKDLLNIESIVFNVKDPFTWVSGIKSPVYCDNRRINSFVSTRNRVVDAFVQFIAEEFDSVEIIAGVATGGIPLGILIADRLNLPFVYVRQEAKKHGMMKQIEGHFTPNARVVLIEDHISTGGSSLKAVDGIRKANLELLGLVSIMTYGFQKSVDRFDQASVKYLSLSDLSTALKVARIEEMISMDHLESIESFVLDPENWYSAHFSI